MRAFLLLSLVLADRPDLPGMPDLPDAPGGDGQSSEEVTDPKDVQIIKLDSSEVEDCAKKINKIANDLAEATKDPEEMCPKDPPKAKRAIRKRDMDVYKLENACLPLTSISPAGNVYHEDLIGVDPNTVLTRSGYGRGFTLDGKIDTKNTGGATWTLTRSVSFTKSTMIGVSYSDGTTNTRVNGTSWSDSSSSSITQSINKLIEKSNSTAYVHENSGSLATELHQALAKAHDNSTATTQTFSNETTLANAVTWNDQFGTNNITDVGTDYSNTTGKDVTTGWDKSNDHTKSTDITVSKSVACTFTKSGTNSNTKAHEYGWQVSGGASGSLEFGGGIPLIASAKGTLGLHIEGGGSGSHTTTGSITKESSSSVTVTYTVTRTDTDAKTVRCSTSGSTVEHGTNTSGGHHNTQDGTSKNRDDGGSRTTTTSGSESRSNESRASDSISDTITRGNTTTDGWSRGQTDTYGGSTTDGITNTTDIGVSSTRGGEFSASIANTITKETTKQETDSTTWELTKGISFNLEKDTCVRPVCSPEVTSTIIPWLCKPPNLFDKLGNPVVQVVTTEFQSRKKDEQDLKRRDLDPNFNNMVCNYQWITCKDELPKNQLVFRPGPWYNYIYSQGIFSDQNFTAAMTSDPTDEGYYFGWGEGNEFQVKRIGPSGVKSASDGASWRTGVKLPQASNIVFKITDDGHLNIYASNVYNYFPAYTGDEWNRPKEVPLRSDLVWSSLPFHLDYAVGVYGNRNKNKNFGYRLMINKNGIPELYDSVYVKIWSGDNDLYEGNKHCYGYKFPTTVSFPLLNPPDDPLEYCNYRSPSVYTKDQIDIHNNHPEGIKWIGSELVHGTAMNEGEGLKSGNGRFTLHLSKTGNLILKEGCRTMWESATANRWFGEGPFKAIVSTNGDLYVKDFQNRAIWSSLTPVEFESKMIKVNLTDTGNLVGLNKDVVPVWQSRKDVEGVSNTWRIWNIPVVIFDDEAEKPAITVENFPLVNMFNSRCLSVDQDNNLTTGLAKINYTTGTVDFSECLMWNYNPLMYTYSPTTVLGQCLGPGGIQTCDKNTLWRHYEDGLLTNVESTFCLNATAKAVPCTASRVRIDKLWNRGFKAVNDIATNSTNLLLQGQMFYQNIMGFRFFPDAQHKLTFQVFDYNRPKDIKNFVWNTGLVAKDTTFLRLLYNGLSANVSTIPRPDGKPFQSGKLPYRLSLTNKTLSVKDADSNSLWYWNFRK